jgi:hypothetical protein
MNYIYHGEYALLAEARLERSVARGTALPIRVQGQWLACTDEICVPESGSFGTDLVAGTGAVTDGERFDGYRVRLPRPLGNEAAFELDGDTLRIGISFPAGASVSAPYFFSRTDRVLDYSAEQGISRNGDMLIVEVPAESEAGAVATIEGLLKIGEHEGLELVAVPGDVPAAGVPISGDPVNSSVVTADIGTILFALGGAILGGVLLNIMPCIFPILSLKA